MAAAPHQPSHRGIKSGPLRPSEGGCGVCGRELGEGSRPFGLGFAGNSSDDVGLSGVALRVGDCLGGVARFNGAGSDCGEEEPAQECGGSDAAEDYGTDGGNDAQAA